MKLVDFTHFYVESKNVQAKQFILVDEEAKHATRVLRKREGDELIAVDGRGNLFVGEIAIIDKRQVIVNITETVQQVGEPETQLTIVQGAPKGNRFDIVVEKATEIGVFAFQPILTQYSIIDPNARIDRWQQKAIAAMKQCGRSYCPQIHAPIPFEQFLQNFSGTLFIAHESTEDTVSLENVELARQVALLIGPEGGFSDAEFKLALQYGAVPMYLGKRRLRSETAALVGAIKILHHANELN